MYRCRKSDEFERHMMRRHCWVDVYERWLSAVKKTMLPKRKAFRCPKIPASSAGCLLSAVALRHHGRRLQEHAPMVEGRVGLEFAEKNTTASRSHHDERAARRISGDDDDDCRSMRDADWGSRHMPLHIILYFCALSFRRRSHYLRAPRAPASFYEMGAFIFGCFVTHLSCCRALNACCNSLQQEMPQIVPLDAPPQCLSGIKIFMIDKSCRCHDVRTCRAVKR